MQAAEDLAEALSSDERIEVVLARGLGSGPYRALQITDVVLAVDIGAGQLPLDGPPVVVLSDGLPPRKADALHAWLPVHSSLAEIRAAILAVASDLYVLTPDQFRNRLSPPAVELNDSRLLPERLTQREVQVLAMMADGLANKEIAASLSISGNTVKFHVAQVLAKLGVASRTEAVRIGIRRGLITI